MREDGDRVVRAQPDLVGNLVGPPDDEAVDIGKPLGRRERRATVDHDRLEPELAREAHQRPGNLHAADDDESRADREHLDEQRSTAELDRPRQASTQRVGGGLDQRRVELGAPERPAQLAILGHHELRLGR